MAVGIVPVYACLDECNSVRVPPAGQTRTQTFCPTCLCWRNGCRTEACLFMPAYTTRYTETYHKARTKAKQRNDRTRRYLRKELKASCWNCAAVRQMGKAGYGCAYELKPIPESARRMQRRNPCEHFDWRETTTPEPMEQAMNGERGECG